MKQFFLGLREDTPILRCVFGVTIALIVATSLGYIIPHITAVFALMFLGPGMKPMGLKKEIGIVIALAVIGYFGVFLGNYLIDYPLVILPLLGLIIFWSFRLVKIPEPVRLLFLMLAVIIPFLSLKANILGSFALKTLLINLIVALVVVRIVYYIFPLTAKEKGTSEKKQATQVAKDIDMDKVAFNGLVVVLPLVFVFYLFNATIAILTLVFALLLSFDPFVYQSKKGPALLLANVLGGFVGILVYNILIMAPSFVLYFFLTLSVAFYFVFQIYSGKKTAPIFKISFNTFFVIMGVISTSNNDAGGTVFERLLQIGLAILYLIIAYRIINALNNPKILHE